MLQWSDGRANDDVLVLGVHGYGHRMDLSSRHSLGLERTRLANATATVYRMSKHDGMTIESNRIESNEQLIEWTDEGLCWLGSRAHRRRHCFAGRYHDARSSNRSIRRERQAQQHSRPLDRARDSRILLLVVRVRCRSIQRDPRERSCDAHRLTD